MLKLQVKIRNVTEEAAAAEAERLAQEELAKISDKAERDLQQSKLDEEKAMQAIKEAQDALEAAKLANDMAAIEEAQRLKKEADERARTTKMIKRLKEAIQKRDLRELEDTIRDAKKKKVLFKYFRKRWPIDISCQKCRLIDPNHAWNQYILFR